MKTYFECVICHQRQALRIARLITPDARVQEKIMRDVMAHLSEASWDTDPLTMTKGVYEVIHRITGISDPYKALKYRSNQEVLQIYPELQEYIRESHDPLLTACKLAVAGNIMDFGAKEHFDIHDTIQHVLQTDFAINEYERFKASLEKAPSLLVFADNAGEIVFDKLLLETILHRYPLEKVTFVIKEHPIINDATLDDVQQIGLAELSNIEFRTFRFLDPQQHTRGETLWSMEDVKAWIHEHDLVLSKGQANYEMFDELPGIFFLLISKCDILAEDSGTHVGALLFKYNQSSF